MSMMVMMMSDVIFRPIHVKFGYKDLQSIGFFCYRSDGWGDWHKNSRLPNVRVLGNSNGFQVWERTDNIGGVHGFVRVSDYISDRDLDVLKEELLKHR